YQSPEYKGSYRLSVNSKITNNKLLFATPISDVGTLLSDPKKIIYKTRGNLFREVIFKSDGSIILRTPKRDFKFKLTYPSSDLKGQDFYITLEQPKVTRGPYSSIDAMRFFFNEDFDMYYRIKLKGSDDWSKKYNIDYIHLIK
ncbi:hypothetical protein, partial [Vibrio rarus]